MSPDIERDGVIVSLAAAVEAAGVPDDFLDDLVHNLAAAEAAAVNNGGVQAQVEYAVTLLGHTEAAREILALLAGRPAPG